VTDTNGTHSIPGSPDAPASWASLLRVYSALQSRAALSQRLGTMFDGRRPMHSLLGYLPEGSLRYRDFKARSLRQHLAHRLVRVYPEATWAQPPSVEEDNTSDTPTPFEAAWTALATRLQVFAQLERTDTLANLGRYAVLLIGLRGQSDLSQPARPVRGPDDVLYLTPYSEEWATVERLEGNPGLPTFGQPLLYRINFGRNNAQGQAVLPVGQGLVHASRVLHVAEDLLDDEVYATPRLEPIYDLLDDLMKVVGGAAEMFWVDAKRRLVVSMREGYAPSPDPVQAAKDEQGLADEVDEFMHELRNVLRVSGVDVTPLNGTVPSPLDHVTVILDLISAATAIPKRILFGTERGQLASEQDTEAWLSRITRRQKQFAEQWMLRPLVDRLLAVNALPALAQPYIVSWDNLLSLSEDQQATIAQKVAGALSTYAGAGMAELIVPPQEFRSVYLGLSEVSEFELPELDLAPGEGEDGDRPADELLDDETEDDNEDDGTEE
jgi:hypothetical protein